MKTLATQKMQFAMTALILLMLCPFGLFSQQVIKFKNGNVYEVRIVSKNADSIRYEMTNAPGVLFSASMREVESVWTQSKILKGQPSLPDSLYYAEKISKARSQVAVGVVLGVTGGIGVLAGILINVDKDSYGHPEEPKDARNQAFKTILIAAGSAIAITGIVLAAVGGSKQAKYQNLMKKVALDFRYSPSNTGLALRFKF